MQLIDWLRIWATENCIPSIWTIKNPVTCYLGIVPANLIAGGGDIGFKSAIRVSEGIMNRSLITAAAAVTLLGISSFQSAQSADPANQSVQVPGKASYKLAPQEFVDYAHSYVLETGHTLKLRQQVNRYFAQLKGESEVEIYPQEPGAFVSQSGATLAFKDEGDMVMVTSLNRLQIASTEPQFEGVQIASK